MWYLLPASTALALALGLVWAVMRRRGLVAARANSTMETFNTEFERSGYSRRAIETAYADLRGLCGFPVGRRDILEKLGVLPEDFENMLEKRCLSLNVGDLRTARYARLLPVRSADDYVRLLDEMMRE